MKKIFEKPTGPRASVNSGGEPLAERIRQLEERVRELEQWASKTVSMLNMQD